MCLLEIPRDSMEPLTIWRLNDSHGLFWEGRIDANYTTQNTWIHDNKYTSGKNRVSLTISSNLMKIFPQMAEEWWFELNMTWCVTFTGSRTEGLNADFRQQMFIFIHENAPSFTAKLVHGMFMLMDHAFTEL